MGGCRACDYDLCPSCAKSASGSVPGSGQIHGAVGGVPGGYSGKTPGGYGGKAPGGYGATPHMPHVPHMNSVTERSRRDSRSLHELETRIVSTEQQQMFLHFEKYEDFVSPVMPWMHELG